MLNAFPEAVGPDGQSTLSVCPATCGLERTVSSYKGWEILIPWGEIWEGEKDRV